MNKNLTELEEVLVGLAEQLESNEVIKLYFEDFAKLIPSYRGDFELDSEAIRYLSEHFQKFSIESEPRVRRGIFKRQISSPIYIYKSLEEIDHLSLSYKHGLLVVRMAALMALVDRNVEESEVHTIRAMIWEMQFLSSCEKRALYAKAKYIIDAGNELGSHGIKHKKLLLNRNAIIERLSQLSISASTVILDVAKEVAIADNKLEQSETNLLRELYRALGMNVRSVNKDLQEYAKSKNVVIKNQTKNGLITESQIEEIEDVLGELLLDFEDF